MTIKVLHFADVHIGMENYGRIDPGTGISSRVMDFLRQMTHIIEYAEDHDADLAIFAGDAFKTRNPNPTFQREFARRIVQLSRQCPVVLLVGNHDIPMQVGKASSVDIFHTLDVHNVIVGRVPELHAIETKAGPVNVATVPYPVKQRLLQDLNTRGMNMAQLDEEMRRQVALVIENLAQEAREKPEIPAILTGHFTVQGARLGSERGVMLGRDVAVMTSTLADEEAWDYVALGHIHYHQNMNDTAYPPVVYSGSIERIDFGEEGDPKGFCWVNLERANTTYEFVPVKARPFVTIRADVRDQPEPMDSVLHTIRRHDVRGAVVRMIVKTTPEVDPLLRDRDIADALADAAHIAAIQHDVEYPVRARLGVEKVEGLGPLELLERYLIAKDYTPERIETLREYAEALLSDDDEFYD